MNAKQIAEIPKNALEVVRVSVTEYRGRTYGDIRIFYEAEDGEWRPTRKGICLAPDLVPELRGAVEELEKALRQGDLIEDEE